jgi:hypothetical protein
VALSIRCSRNCLRHTVNVVEQHVEGDDLAAQVQGVQAPGTHVQTQVQHL